MDECILCDGTGRIGVYDAIGRNVPGLSDPCPQCYPEEYEDPDEFIEALKEERVANRG